MLAPHEIADAVWTPDVNHLIVACHRTGKPFEIRTDRRRVVCPHCGARGKIDTLRERFATRHGK